MAKGKAMFFCKECGMESPKWLGQCPGCKAWNSLVEAPQAGKKTTAYGVSSLSAAEPVLLSEVVIYRRNQFYRYLVFGIVIAFNSDIFYTHFHR